MQAYAQLPYTQNFNAYIGTGFAPTPTAGQLDSDVWKVTGLSDGAGTFGGTHTTGDFARGISTGGVSAGGLYSFTVGAGNNALGAQATGGDFNPGTMVLKVQNNTAAVLTSVTIAYDIYYNNDQARSSSFNFAHSTDDVTYITVPALDFTSPVALDALGWRTSAKTTTITGLSIPVNGFIYFKWSSADVAGSGSRDELALDNVSVTTGAVAPPATNAVINEYVTNHAVNPDTNDFIEVFGTASTSYATLTLLQIEGDVNGNRGDILFAQTVGTTDANGYWTTGYMNETLQGGNSVLLLVEGFTGTLGDDLDSNNDGVLNGILPWTSVKDEIAISSATTGNIFGFLTLNNNFDGSPFNPEGASRIPNGTDTNTTADWKRNDFDGFGFPGFAGSPLVTEAVNTLGEENRMYVAPTGTIIVTQALTSFTTTALNTASAQQSYQVSGTTLTSPITITAPAMFEVSLTSGGPFTSSVSIPAATANAGNTTVYIRYLPTAGTSHTGNITHVSTGATSVNVAVNGSVVGTITPIYSLQGAGTATPFALGTAITTIGVVTADFQTDAQMRGFFIQDETGDGNPLTSDGIFVYILPTDVNWVDVAVGQRVRVAGNITEYFGLTQINTVTNITILGAGVIPTPVNITFPESVDGELEKYEGMYANITNTMTVAQNYFWGRYGQLSLSANGRFIQPTQLELPGSAAYTALVDTYQRNLLTLDDGSTFQNPNPLAYTGLSNTVRAGDEVTNLTGIVHYDRINPNNTNDYTFHPTVAPTITRSNPRTVAPSSVGAAANVKVASFNVLNYFNDLTNPDNRGAENALELQRQEDKLIPAILGLNADVIGLMEISNIDGALTRLVTLLNTATAPGTWATITHPFPGTDAIKVALIYKTAVVTPFGAAVSSTNAIFDRPPLAQTFTLVSNAEKFTVVVNHFKSKGGTGTGADADSGNGAGNFNARRTQQAAAVRTLVTSIQTATSDNDVIVVGDLNAYAQEDPIRDFTTNGFVNLIDQYVGNANAYSFIFDSYSGYLDHALATPSLAAQTTGATEWRINGDEPFVIDYNTNFKAVPPATTGSPDYWSATPYRSSDHDPVIVGLNLQAPAPLVTTLSPADDATNVAITTDLVLTFDRNVQAGTGNITVTDGTTPITFPIAGNAAATVTILNNVVTINLTADLANATNYHVLIPAGVIKSTTGTNFAGFALATDWNFTTVALAPVGGGGATPSVTTPTNFRAVAISTSQINLTWTPVSGATGYILYRGNTAIATLLGSATSFQDTGLMADTFYNYRLVATNGNRLSDPAQTNARTFPDAPIVLSLTNACSGSNGIMKVTSTGVVYRVYADMNSLTPLFQTDNATIMTPAITQTTTFYVSVVSASSGLESTRTAITVNVNPLPTAMILEERIFSCSSVATLTAQEVTGATYYWLINGQSIGMTTVPTFETNRSGNHQVRVVLNGCSVTSASVIVALNFVPLAEIAQGIIVRSCESATTLSARDAGTNATYEWTRNNVLVANTASVSVSQSGTYTLTVTQNGCSASDEVEVEISTLNPNVSFTVSQTTFCPEESVTLTVDSPSANVVYTWVRNGRVLTRVTGTEYVTSVAGEYRVRASQNNCSVLSEPITITRTRVEPVYLVREGDVLSVQSIATITDVVWFLENEEQTALAGQMSFTPTVKGNYSARVTFETGCKGSPYAPFYYKIPEVPVITGEENNISVETIIYPNPSKTGVFRIQLSSSITSDITLTITDNIGRVLENKTIKANEISTIQTIDLSQYAKGMYAISIDTEQGNIVKKIIIE